LIRHEWNDPMMRFDSLIRRPAPFAAGIALALLLAAALPFPVVAQTSPDQMQSLLDRVDRLQRDLGTLQRQVYQGGGSRSGSSGNSGNSGAAAPSGSDATNLEIRLQGIEEQLQTLRGQIEDASFQAKSVSDRLDKLSSDVDFRLSAIEKKVGLTPGASGDVPQQPATPQLTPPSPQDQGTVFIPPDAANDAGKQAAATPAAALPQGAPSDQLAYAMGLLNQNDYAGGEKAFKEFLSQHPTDPLAGNAQYWLGRTYFARNNFNDATRTFAEGYKKYPQSPRAAENLLYLGRSLAGLNQKANACQAYARLLSEYPKSVDATKASAQAERKKLACS
jgi:tol-pal system protein YbgF